MATIYDVARQAGVSSGTVSRYLTGNGYVGEKARAHIQQAIQELGFSPSSVARGLIRRRTRMIGFVVPDLLNPFVPEVVRGAQDLADEENYCLLVYNTDENGAREARALKLLHERRVDGLIVLPPETPEGNHLLAELHARGVPIVLIGRRLEGLTLDRVSTSTYEGALEAIAHLISLGHTRIAFIGGDFVRGVAPGRRQGYLDGMHNAGLSIDERWIVETQLSHEGGAEAMERLLQQSERPTAVFAVNDIIAIGAIQTCMRLGMRVPADISVVGFDDIALSARMWPPLTTVAQPRALLGRTALEVLLKRVEEQDDSPAREICLPCSLVIRGSTSMCTNVE